MNVRMISYGEYPSPNTSYSAWDDLVILNEDLLQTNIGADFNYDCNTDLFDFAAWSRHWYDSGPSIYDLTDDNIVDIGDLGEFSTYWLNEN